jgi:hypothetical protein
MMINPTILYGTASKGVHLIIVPLYPNGERLGRTMTVFYIVLANIVRWWIVPHTAMENRGFDGRIEGFGQRRCSSRYGVNNLGIPEDSRLWTVTIVTDILCVA